MDIHTGSVVYSKAGRDKGDIFLVLETDKEYAYIANGKSRKLEKPKKKKLKHLTNSSIALAENFSSNAAIRKALAQFKSIH